MEQEGPVRAGDMDAAEFRRHGYAVIDRIARYLEQPEAWPVLPQVEPGFLRSALPADAPVHGESMEDILADFDRLILPGTTHWNHPGFFAYFAISGSAPGILAESLTAALNVNAMLWQSGPAATELEETTLAWLRRLLGLPADFDGTINDTASSSTLYALAAAREAWPELRTRQLGIAGRPDVPELRVYCSSQAHSSVHKAVITLGMGLEGVREIAVDGRLALDPAALRAAIAEDRAAGRLPIAVVATVGTTSTAAIDPVAAIADVCAEEGLWLHVDASYGGAAAILPEMRHVLAGAERADSLVVNPHKWLLTPVDCSVLYTRRPDVLRRAFSLVPEYLTTSAGDVRNLMDYGVSLGRRFRSLKLWFVLRWFGSAGLQQVLRRHMELARNFAAWVDADAGFERLAPVDFSLVVFRHRPAGVTDEAVLDELNMQVLQRLNASGEVFLSHTRVQGRYGLRLAIGNVRTEHRHVARAWQLAREAAENLR